MVTSCTACPLLDASNSSPLVTGSSLISLLFNFFFFLVAPPSSFTGLPRFRLFSFFPAAGSALVLAATDVLNAGIVNNWLSILWVGCVAINDSQLGRKLMIIVFKIISFKYFKNSFQTASAVCVISYLHPSQIHGLLLIF